jgi:ferredoxin
MALSAFSAADSAGEKYHRQDGADLSPYAPANIMTPDQTQVILQDTGTAFTCLPGQPLLDAAYEAGVALPYACRRGICGLCAAQLVHGEVRPVDALPMTNARCSPSEVLLCRCTAVTQQVVIRPSSAQRMPVARRLPPLHVG